MYQLLVHVFKINKIKKLCVALLQYETCNIFPRRLYNISFFDLINKHNIIHSPITDVSMCILIMSVFWYFYNV